MKDASFLPALPVILQKRPLLKPLAKTSQPLARKLNFTALFHINATCPWNAQITASVFMTGNAPLTVLSAFPLKFSIFKVEINFSLQQFNLVNLVLFSFEYLILCIFLMFFINLILKL